jgi:homoserine dehydrogenase
LQAGLDIVGFGPIGRELAKRIASEKELVSKFLVISISDSSGTIFPKKQTDVLKAVDWKISGRKLSELDFGKQRKKSSIFVDLTNSDYNRAQEARKRALYALQSGKHFVAASKVALSNYFDEIFTMARRRKLEIGYGATICGGRHAVSVASNIEPVEMLSASAVLNASTTMILSTLEQDKNITFDTACQKASESGILESDWSIDLDGIDAAAKAAILGNALFPKSKSSISKVVCRGIRDEEAKELIKVNRTNPETRTRLVAEITKEKISVAPKSLPPDSALAVSGRFNAVQFETKTLGQISVRNLGGGVALTTAVVLSDLKRLASV